MGRGGKGKGKKGASASSTTDASEAPADLFWEVVPRYIQDEEVGKRCIKFMSKCWAQARSETKMLMEGRMLDTSVAEVNIGNGSPEAVREGFVKAWIADVLFRLYQAGNGLDMGLDKYEATDLFMQVCCDWEGLPFEVCRGLDVPIQPWAVVEDAVQDTFRDLYKSNGGGGGGKKKKSSGGSKGGGSAATASSASRLTSRADDRQASSSNSGGGSGGGSGGAPWWWKPEASTTSSNSGRGRDDDGWKSRSWEDNGWQNWGGDNSWKSWDEHDNRMDRAPSRTPSRPREDPSVVARSRLARNVPGRDWDDGPRRRRIVDKPSVPRSKSSRSRSRGPRRGPPPAAAGKRRCATSPPGPRRTLGRGSRSRSCSLSGKGSRRGKSPSPSRTERKPSPIRRRSGRRSNSRSPVRQPEAKPNPPVTLASGRGKPVDRLLGEFAASSGRRASRSRSGTRSSKVRNKAAKAPAPAKKAEAQPARQKPAASANSKSAGSKSQEAAPVEASAAAKEVAAKEASAAEKEEPPQALPEKEEQVEVAEDKGEAAAEVPPEEEEEEDEDELLDDGLAAELARRLGGVEDEEEGAASPAEPAAQPEVEPEAEAKPTEEEAPSEAPASESPKAEPVECKSLREGRCLSKEEDARLSPEEVKSLQAGACDKMQRLVGDGFDDFFCRKCAAIVEKAWHVSKPAPSADRGGSGACADKSTASSEG
eukprot:TRINITY_DN3338_c0_g1_i1.p1 TRINITY_DN3338_c0_g1~~TRINITY_DN3338_c0_g1_i1.p1  ORF type:complete len:706 (-),score=166.46 TRINITY_DN3338_c0_g1_i1:75-2192(-)